MKKVFLFLISFAVALSAIANGSSFAFNSGNWATAEAKQAVIQHLGRESLHLQSGHILYNEQEMQDGILEVDIAPDPARGMGGIIFRHDGKGNYEELYIRQGKSGQPDAVQYTPVFNGSSSWQLYAEHQAKHVFKPNEWIHVKVEVQGSLAKVYLDHADVPSLVVPNLRHGSRSGKFGLWTLNGAHFSNFRFTPLDPSLAPTKTIAAEPTANVIQHWQVSQPLLVQDTDVENGPGKQLLQWETLQTDEQGLLNIAQYRKKKVADNFEKNSDDMVWVMLKIYSEKEQTKKLYFEYSNKANLFLNGQPMFFGDNSFRAKNPIFRGEIDKGLRTNAVYLPLKKGNNTVLVALSSRANGWGIMGRLDNMSGIKLK